MGAAGCRAPVRQRQKGWGPRPEGAELWLPWPWRLNPPQARHARLRRHVHTPAAGRPDRPRLSPEATATARYGPRGCPTFAILLCVLAHLGATDGGTTGHPRHTGDGLVAPVSIRPSSRGQASEIVEACACAVACSQHMRHWWRIHHAPILPSCRSDWTDNLRGYRRRMLLTPLHILPTLPPTCLDVAALVTFMLGQLAHAAISNRDVLNRASLGGPA